MAVEQSQASFFFLFGMWFCGGFVVVFWFVLRSVVVCKE